MLLLVSSWRRHCSYVCPCVCDCTTKTLWARDLTSRLWKFHRSYNL